MSGEGTENPARASGRRVAHVFGGDGHALALPVADHEEDNVVAPATLGDTQHVRLHNS